jgi:hypoxanthine phosphoribosyltransferase
MREACAPRPSPLNGGSHIREGLSSQPLSGLNAVMQEDLDRVLFDEATILRRLDELAGDITTEYEGRDLTIVAILNGSLIFMADLLRRIPLPLQLDCLRAASYHGGTKDSRRSHFPTSRAPRCR